MDFGVELKGANKAVLRFENFPTFMHDRLLATLQNIERRLEVAVIAAEPEKSGELRSLTGGRVYDHGNRIAAVVGVRTEDGNQSAKASALEYGSRKYAFAVRAHEASLAHLWSRAIATIVVTVPEHFRMPKVIAHRFLRNTIEATQGEALAEMRAALDQSVKDANS